MVFVPSARHSSLYLFNSTRVTFLFERSLCISFTHSAHSEINVQKAELERFKGAESEGFREVK